MNYREVVFIICDDCGNEIKTTRYKLHKGINCKYCKAIEKSNRPKITKMSDNYKLYYVKIEGLYKIGITRHTELKYRFVGYKIEILGLWEGEEIDIKSVERHLVISKSLGVLKTDTILQAGYTEMSYKPILSKSDLFLLNKTYLSLL